MGTIYDPYTYMRHYWQGSIDDDILIYSGGDDFINDTPTQENPNFGCPSHPKISCNNNGDMFQNYMDYSNDGCMNMFTHGQKQRMRATLDTIRTELISCNNGSHYNPSTNKIYSKYLL